MSNHWYLCVYRFVWRFRQGGGYFVFREIRADENIMETIMKSHCALPNSLIVSHEESNVTEIIRMVLIEGMCG